MPQKILCSDCGYVLYYGEDLVYPNDVLRKYDYRCPRCGKRLKLDSEKIEVRKISE